MAYTPPAGSAVNLIFGPTTYTPPGGGSVAISFVPPINNIYPSGFCDEAFGSGAIGTTDFILPSGFTGAAFGTATIYNLTQYVYPTGIAPTGFGTLHIYDAIQYVNATGIAPKGFGTQLVQHDTQTVDQAGRGIGPKGFGTAFVALAVRYVYPTGIIPHGFGAHTIGTDQFVVPAGFDEEAFGTLYIHDDRQFPQMQGWKDEAFGTAELTRSPRIIDVAHGADSPYLGTNTIYNLTQIVYPYFDPATSEREQFGDPIWVIVENRNRNIGPTKLVGRFGRPDVENAAVPIAPAGFDAITFGAGTFISDANRTVTAPGPLDPIVGYFGQWTQITKPPELFPTSFDSSRYGTASILNLNRNMPVQGFSDDGIGTAFIDFAIRYLHTPLGVEGFYGMPDVQNSTRYVAPLGFTPNFVFGGPELQIHFNVIANHGFDAGHMGLEHYIYNSTPQIDPYVYDASTYGATQIRNDHEFRAIQGFNSETWSRLTDISYRTKTLAAHGIGAGPVSVFAHIYNDTPDPPGQQYIIPTGWTGALGTTVVRHNEIAPAGFNAIGWGTAVVHLQGAECAIFGGEQFGTALMVGPQYVQAHSFPPAPGPDPLNFGTARIDPYTITAPNPAHPVDADLHTDPLHWDMFGLADVENQIRYVTNLHDNNEPAEAFGTAFVDYYDRRIYPTGIKPPYIVGPGLNYPQTVDLDITSDGIPSEEAFGANAIGWVPPYTVTLQPNTWFSQGLGRQTIDFLNRFVSPHGWDSSIMFAPHRVGYPIPMNASVGETITFGAGTFVSFKNRDIPPQGWDDFVSDYDLQDFDGRMRVTRTAHTGIAARGFDSGEFGLPGIRVGGQTVDIAYMDVLFDS